MERRFKQTVIIHREVLLRVATQMTGSPARAEDLTQETLLKAYGAFDRLRPESRVRPWLLRILRNTYISEWRKCRREREVLQQSVDEDLAGWLQPNHWETPETLGGRPDADLSDEVIEALAEVPRRYRACVLLVDLHQKSYRETAWLTEQPLGTVQSRLFRGRRILKDLLRGYAHQEGYLARAA